MNQKNFIRWALDHGSEIHPNVKIGSDEFGGCGAFATGDIEAGEPFLSIPHTLVMSIVNLICDRPFILSFCRLYLKITDEFSGMEAFELTVNCENGNDEQLVISAHDLLVLALCFHRNTPESFWHFYCQSLPASIASPLMFSRKELKNQLGGTGLDVVAQTRLMRLKKSYDDLSPAVDWLTWDDYLWASMMISSRAFKYLQPATATAKDFEMLIIHKIGLADFIQSVDSYRSLIAITMRVPCMLPLMDLLNHKPFSNITWNSGPSYVSFKCGNKILKDDQIYNNYGPKGNEELFLGYGFCINHEDYGGNQAAIDYCRISLAASHLPEPKVILLRRDLQNLNKLIDATAELVNSTSVGLTLRHVVIMLQHRLKSLTGQQRTSTSIDYPATSCFKYTQRIILELAVEELERQFWEVYNQFWLNKIECDLGNHVLHSDPANKTTLPDVLYPIGTRRGVKTDSLFEKGQVVFEISSEMLMKQAFYEELTWSQLDQLKKFEVAGNFEDLSGLNVDSERLEYIRDTYNDSSLSSRVDLNIFVQYLLVSENYRYLWVNADTDCTDDRREQEKEEGLFILPQPLNHIRFVTGYANVYLKLNNDRSIHLIALKTIGADEELLLAATDHPISNSDDKEEDIKYGMLQAISPLDSDFINQMLFEPGTSTCLDR